MGFLTIGLQQVAYAATKEAMKVALPALNDWVLDKIQAQALLESEDKILIPTALNIDLCEPTL